MADCIEVTPIVSRHYPAEGEGEGGGGDAEKDAGGGLTDAQRDVLERCLHTLKHAKNDSHTLAALLLVSLNIFVMSVTTWAVKTGKCSLKHCVEQLSLLGTYMTHRLPLFSEWLHCNKWSQPICKPPRTVSLASVLI